MKHQIEKPAIGRSAIEIEKTSRARVFSSEMRLCIRVGLTVRDSSDVCACFVRLFFVLFVCFFVFCVCLLLFFQRGWA
jgi:hypothetical protein